MARQDDTARASLDALSKIGEGWHLAVAVAIADGKHKALGMSRRDFANAAGGFRLADPRDAIIELHRQGMSMAAIADVLGVDAQKTVARVLVEEGHIEDAYLGTGRSAPEIEASTGRSAPDDDIVDADVVEDDGLLRRIGELEETLEEQRRQQKAALKEARERAQNDVRELKRQLTLLQRQLKEMDEESPEDFRQRQEAEAQLAEMEAQILARASEQIAYGVVRTLDTATEQLTKLLREGLITPKMIDAIGVALRSLNDEYAIAEATARDRVDDHA